MTQPPDEYGDVLRRALRAEADAVVPSPEGLQIIRARIERRGIRNLFWWRAGAAAASAVLVAGTIVMVVPGLRSQVLQIPSNLVENSTQTPGNSSTRLSTPPKPPSRTVEQPSGHVVLPPSESETHRPTESARSTRQPSPSPSPSPSSSPCPSGEPADQDCPEITPTPTPTPTPSEVTELPTGCPADECPPDDMPTGPSDLSSPLVDVPHTTP
ncbi:MAG: hypothetical protein HOW71_15730 [Nonomuraea sp.]|nr:hypothetical protein [Nonomuraea sp.]